MINNEYNWVILITTNYDNINNVNWYDDQFTQLYLELKYWNKQNKFYLKDT